MTETNKDSNKKFDSKSSAEADLNFRVVNLEQEKIKDWLEKVKFRKQFIGGVSEQDVWRKIRELNALYEQALGAERVRYDTLIAEYNNTPDGAQEGMIPATEKNGEPGEQTEIP